MAEDRVVSERLIVEFDTTTTDVFNTLSPDGLRVASMAKKLERAALGEWSEKWVLVVDGQEQGRYEGLGDIVFSPDSQRWACVALTSPGAFWIVDGQAQPQYENVSGLIFSPNSQRWAHAADVDKRQSVILDGQELMKYDAVGDPIFSPDSQRI